MGVAAKKQKSAKQTKVEHSKTTDNRTQTKSPQNSDKFESDCTVALSDFAIDEIVWPKLRGSPHWPARILSIDKKIEIFWYNDYRKSKNFKSQLFKFQANFDVFSKKSDSNTKLESAIKEALVFLKMKYT